MEKDEKKKNNHIPIEDVLGDESQEGWKSLRFARL